MCAVFMSARFTLRGILRAMLWSILHAVNVAMADVPATPFAGAYGATAGGGALTGWTRHGGDNPAVLGPPGYGGSLAGYAPFGLAGLRVTELEASRDAARGGVSLGWRHVADKGGDAASRVRVRFAARGARGMMRGLSVGVQGDLYRTESASAAPSVGGETGGGVGGDGGGDAATAFGWSAGVGGMVALHPALSLGATGEFVPTVGGRGTHTARTGWGISCGTSLARVMGAGAFWRMTAEYEREWGTVRRAEGLKPDAWRFAGALRLHPSFGVYAGYAPGHETASLGVAFGAGGWRGYSAVRRHAALGATAVQGAEWSSAGGGP